MTTPYNNYPRGVGTYGNPKIMNWDDGGSLRIGKYVSIADDVTILLGGNHRAEWVTVSPLPAVLHGLPPVPGICISRGTVVIENDVWLGHGCTILSGVTIGSGACIGACAVVAQDVPPYAIVFGNPAKILRYRFPRDIIERMLEIAWWDWDEAKIRHFAPLLTQGDITKFLRAVADYDRS